jgi:methylated-DNA-[protein]-cysteine S-methyltransferase
MIRFDEIASPVGPLTIAERAGRLCLLHFGPLDDHVLTMFERWYPREPRERRPIPAIATALARYFAGEIHAINDVAVELNGTPFQKSVWNALRRIPAGSTVSYATLAKRIGQRTAVRAVGAANGANPVAIVVPCHRVIGSDGSLTGYGGGLERKQWLLAHEGVVEKRLF